MVKTIHLTPDEVQHFVEVASGCDFDIDISYNRYVVDAKSFLGVYGLDFSKALKVSYEGFDADLILVDFTAPHLMPTHNVFSSLVYSAGGSDVALTMVRGKILYAGGKFETIDLAQVVREMSEHAIDRLFTPEEK